MNLKGPKKLKLKTILGTNFQEVLDVSKAALSLCSLSIEFLKRNTGEEYTLGEVYPVVLAAMNVFKNKEEFLDSLEDDEPSAEGEELLDTYKILFCVKVEALRSLGWWDANISSEDINDPEFLTNMVKEASPRVEECIINVCSVVQASLVIGDSAPSEDPEEYYH